VRRTERLLRPILREDVALEILLPREPLPAMVDPVQLEQVLMNLVTNARDAMPAGGRVTVAASGVELDAARARSAGLETPGRYAQISVADTGTGIEREKQARVFEPFFTTKEIGKGTGLGLAIAYGVVKQHHGALSLVSEPGHGATFTFFLPLLASTTSLHGAAQPDDGPPPGGNETLLVAEDDAALRRMLRRVLEGAGYAVIEAEDGDEAVARFREERARIHLAVLDVIMPGRNGRLALDEIRRIDPSMPAVFLSGYTDDPTGEHAIDLGKNPFVPKPVMPEDLLRAVRRELDGRRAAATSVAS
jgi:CheY-like chemotaxis protein